VVPGCRDQADADQHALQEAVVDTLPLATDAPLLAAFLCRLPASYMLRSLRRARRRIRIRVARRAPRKSRRAFSTGAAGKHGWGRLSWEDEEVVDDDDNKISQNSTEISTNFF